MLTEHNPAKKRFVQSLIRAIMGINMEKREVYNGNLLKS